jgi:NIPSNAP
MYTLCIRYTLDPSRIDGFRTYVEHEVPVIREAGGRKVASYLPTDFAGPTNIGLGLIEIETMADYERHRRALAEQPAHVRNATALAESGAVLSLERSSISRHSDNP